MTGAHRSVRSTIAWFLLGALVGGASSAEAGASAEGAALPDYTGWDLEQESTTYRPGTDLEFYAFELKIYVNPANPSDMVVELRRGDVLYIVYHYTVSVTGPRWAIFMDKGFAAAPCGFFDPTGAPTASYVRMDVLCLRETERVDMRTGR